MFNLPRSSRLLIITSSILLALSFNGCKDDDTPIDKPILVKDELSKFNMGMGNPSNATTATTNEENYLIERPQYSLSYSKSRGIPNWVSWYLHRDWLGNTNRQDDFRADPMLPASWYHVNEFDYDYWDNGFHRGHNCPSADRTSSRGDNSATFYMTNMIPQAPDNNTNLWADFESFCRGKIRSGKELYIVMGNYGKGGIGDNGYRERLSDKVTVPRYIWKMVVILDQGDHDADRVDADTRIITILTENDNAVGNDTWGQHRVSVDDIEAATGLDLLSAVPVNVQTVVEAKVDDGPTY
ncbi:MAG TPA: DNA/RNA non-specific endonuclease [Saprospiraceae bacterium]|nr:DNA/RNA non-specific endonuclease [Saprospiraceae bacterium]